MDGRAGGGGNPTLRKFFLCLFVGFTLIGIIALLVMEGIHIHETTSTIDGLKMMNTEQTRVNNEMKQTISAINKQIQDRQDLLLSGQDNLAAILAQKLNGEAIPSSPSPPVMDCDVVIIGAGAGGLTTAYRLAPIFGSRLCVLDNRDHLGGKVKSVKKTTSTDSRPVWTPTHAEQFRGGDAILRCMAQEVGTVVVNRGSVGSFLDYNYLGLNASGYMCFGNNTPTGSATCAAGTASEGFLAPNGYRGFSAYGNNLLPVCSGKDWTQCSYVDEYFKLLVSSSNANTIQIGETFEQYSLRILGIEGTAYFKDLWGVDYMWVFDAKWMVEFLRYDETFPIGSVRMPHGGPQAGLWNRVGYYVTGNQSRIMLNSFVSSVSRSTLNTDKKAGYKYSLIANSTQRIRAKRVVMAMPVQHLADMSGDIVSELRATPYYNYIQATRSCTWNAFFTTRWWDQYRSSCNAGYCAAAKGFNLTSVSRDYITWSYISDYTNGIAFIQYVPTPERQEGNLLRFFWEDDQCDDLNNIFATSGIDGVKNEVMSRARLVLSGAIGIPIPDPEQSYYSYERYAYTGVRPGGSFTSAQVETWATQPIINEDLCIASESVNLLNTGWMEAAARSAHNCMKGKVFTDVISVGTLNSLEACSANLTSGPSRPLSISNKNSGNDVCLLLRNEYHMRDLANYSYCGGPKTYNYPPLASFTSNSYPSPSISLWSGLSTTPVYEPYRYNSRRYT